MNTIMLGLLTMWEMVLILALVLLMFGARKLPDLARGLGQGIKEFRKVIKEEPPKGT
jgi:sec-independent protein translocase protein TatA